MSIDNMYHVALVVFSGLFLFPWVLCLIDKIWKTKYSCRIMGWHNGKGGEHGFDGCSVHATCSKCDKEVMQDSQGNWF